ncbi:MAG: ABC transporter substrate-binding protein [Cyanobacteria bacterium P01_D01_bin.73]
MSSPHRSPLWLTASPSRRRFLKLAGLFSGAVALSTSNVGCQGTGSQQVSESARDTVKSGGIVRVGYLPITDSAPLLVAHDKGFFRNEGLESDRPAPYRSWKAIAKAFMEGQVNVIHILMPASLWLRYRLNFPAKVVAWNHTNGSAITVHPSIKHPEQLGGRTIAIPFWYSIHNVVLQLLLKKHGLKSVSSLALNRRLAPDEVGLVVLPPPDMIKALSNEDIAGYIVAEPFNSAAETARVGRLLRLTGDIWRDHACCVVLMHETDLRDRPNWSQSVVNAIVKAQQWSRGNRPELAHLLSKNGSNYMPQSVDVLDRILNRYSNDFYRNEGAIHHPEWRSRRIDFQPYPFPSYTMDLVKTLKNTLLDESGTFVQDLDPNVVAQDLVDSQFVTRAINLVGGPQAFSLPADLLRSETLEI